MKKKFLSVALSFCLVIASMVLLAGCGTKNFDATKMSVGTKSFTYDGNSHIFEVTYEDLDLSVSYAEKKDGEFKSASELNYVNAGTYNLYYKVSAEGYNDYISEEATALTIAKRDLTIAVGNTTQLVGANNVKPTLNVTEGEIVDGDNLLNDVTFSYNVAGKLAGQTGTATASVTSQNYNVTFTNNPAQIKLIDAVEVLGTTSTYYSNLKDAVEANPNGASIKLWKNIVTTAEIAITSDFTIDGQGQFGIVASNFTAPIKGDNNVFFVNNAEAELTLKDVVVDANGQGRVVRVNAGKLVVDGAVITGGKTVSYAGGVYITGDSVFEMTSGRIYGNQVAEAYATDGYTQYSADLWIGSEANGEVVSTITGGTIDNVFVNANEYSQADSDFTLDGGTITNIYVEYDEGNGAKFKFEDGVVTNLYVSTTTSGVAQEVTAVAGTTYVGGPNYSA